MTGSENMKRTCSLVTHGLSGGHTTVVSLKVPMSTYFENIQRKATCSVFIREFSYCSAQILKTHNGLN